MRRCALASLAEGQETTYIVGIQMAVAKSQGFKLLAGQGDKVPFDRERFKELVHYVIWAAQRYEAFTATKLYKVLWFAEARAFVLRGRPLAGAEYIREKNGPVPKLGKVIRDELEREGKIEGLVSFSPPDVSFLSKEDRQDLDWWVSHIAPDRGTASIDEDRCWQIADIGEALPFNAFMVNRIRDALTDEELAWAKERARKLDLR